MKALRIILAPALLLLCFSAQAQQPLRTLDALTQGELQGPLLEVRFLDVGQGDAIIIKTPAGESLLVDAGPRGAHKKILSNAKEMGITQFDIMVITHSHADHLGGLKELLKSFPVKKIIYSGEVHPLPSNKKLFETVAVMQIPLGTLRPGDALPLKPPVKGLVLHPPGDWTLDDGTDINDTSVVLRISLGDIDFLLTGDAEHLSESQIVSSGATLEAEVLKLGHHGSRTASGQKFLTRVQPLVAVLLCGKKNRYGHPHKETVQALEAKGIKLLRTDTQGTIIIRTDGKQMSIRTGDQDESRFILPPLPGEFFQNTTLRQRGYVHAPRNRNVYGHATPYAACA